MLNMAHTLNSHLNITCGHLGVDIGDAIQCVHDNGINRSEVGNSRINNTGG